MSALTAIPGEPAIGADIGDLAEPPQWLSVDCVVEDETWLTLGDIEAWIMAAANTLPPKLSRGVASEAAISLDTDAAVQRLNKQYRGLDKPTNVLSFPSGDKSGHQLGDIILARETVVREALELGISTQHHVQHLTIHGLLHLLGYDHETDTDAAEMEALETRLLSQLGVPDPYVNTEPA
jgi:probable rRNA maturation factor